jgi:hypothetical protein
MHLRSIAVLLAMVALPLLLLGCGRSDMSAAGDRLDPQLRRLISMRPDTVVGLLIRTTQPLTPRQAEQLTAEGILVGSVVGDIATARARAALAARLAELPYVIFVQLAATIPTSGR